MKCSPVTISLIVPCWKDFQLALDFARKWSGHPLVHEVIVAGVEGELAKNAAIDRTIKLCVSPRPSRGAQMNRGAEFATGDVLLFHHVDSTLTEPHLHALAEAMRDARYVGGGFYRKFDERHSWLRRLEKIERWHCRVFGTIYGDQSVFVRRDHFRRIGGFAPIPLMEDVDLSRRLRRSGKVVLLDPPMQSSPRNQLERAAWKITLRNSLFLVLFRLGLSAERLHRWYYATPTETRSAPLRAERDCFAR